MCVGVCFTLAGGALAALSAPLACLPFVAFGTGAVEVSLHAVTRGPVLAGVGLTGVRPAGNLLESGGRVTPRHRERGQGWGSGSSHQSQSGGEPIGREPGLNQASGPVRRLNKAPPSRPSRRRDTGGALAEATATSFSVYTEAAVKMAVFI